MSEIKRINLPLTDEVVRSLKAGDNVLLSGELYTGRDAAHKRLIEAIDANQALPLPIEHQTIYYVGPAPAKPGEVIGSAGPTTSYRMDDLTLPLLERGLKGMIGKGERAEKVIEGMKKYGAVYFAAIGGAGALIASTIIKKEVIAYEDLGAEAIHRLVVKDFPAIVVIDSEGNNLYRTEREKYKGE
ncbi:MAG: Fe-S-containing hydro-lyase [Clostridia bacterium]|nr:Fe-S-containing hydro-lyase [Clostridia bacterium]